ncbi:MULTISPECIES: sigma D regulator [Halopseudomonas]|jgi:regulator of sigma D|uniref:Regulator of sigma D n=1 Tax=Halopseudomonas formosensis TaxID=1002526 RepID=A0A1I6BPP9_9GAMM|nr:sigma D regulator [Halopseudomonas formosensis]MDX9686392.1 sigma D regulator [Halopseudomonas formosensis]MDY3198446.1 sigma D regulator [Pseudomonadaceae bacterium]NLC00263.1 sigma D regulator [Halopseudomonas formosensis]SFQ82912.1 regulator of sigma D [Halopseudomonas formosensis]
MLEKYKNAQERWGGVDRLIDRWLADRKELVDQYIALRDQTHEGRSVQEQLNLFCSALLDYVSAGHFSVYEQLVRGAEEAGDDRALELMARVMPRIETITQFAVLFNDYYGARTKRVLKEDVMRSRLLKMGGLLDERFELEDCLIEVLHNAHRQPQQATATVG